MRERLFLEMIDSKERKALLKALENEQKFRRIIPIVNKEGEKIAETSKWDTYTGYIDFWLLDIIDDSVTQKRGAVQEIETYDYMTQKGIEIQRVKEIIA